MVFFASQCRRWARATRQLFQGGPLCRLPQVKARASTFLTRRSQRCGLGERILCTGLVARELHAGSKTVSREMQTNFLTPPVTLGLALATVDGGARVAFAFDTKNEEIGPVKYDVSPPRTAPVQSPLGA